MINNLRYKNFTKIVQFFTRYSYSYDKNKKFNIQKSYINSKIHSRRFQKLKYSNYRSKHLNQVAEKRVLVILKLKHEMINLLRI